MKKINKLLLGIFLTAFFVRLLLAFFMPSFTYESYFHLRQVAHISETGLPLYQDPLSYGGREYVFLPLFHYLAAFFDLFLPLTVVAKVLPNLLLASLTLLTYLIASQTTNSRIGSIFSAGVAGFLPVLFTTNAFTPQALFLPLAFLAVYAFLNLPKKKYAYLYLVSFFLTSLTSPVAFLLILGQLIYLLLSLVEGKKPEKGEVELIIVSVFFYLWLQLVFFNKVLAQEGIGFIWQNIPTAILPNYFPTVSVGAALLLLSVLPLLTGMYVIYRSLFHLRQQKSFLLISMAIATILFTSFHFIPLKLALGFLGIIFAIFFASGYEELIHFLQKTRFSFSQHRLVVILVLLLLFTLVYPALTTAFTQEMPSAAEREAFTWIATHTEKEVQILAPVQEGHLITFLGQRKNVMDDLFSLVDDVEHRFKDVNELYTTHFETQALSLLEKYGVMYIVMTPHAQQQYQLKRPLYLSPECFQLVYNKEETRIYHKKCSLEKTEKSERG